MSIQFRHKPGLVAYITCGDPSLEVSHDVALAAIEAGADVIELGVPFSDPVADGTVIQSASERALANGTDLTGVLGVARTIRQNSQAGIGGPMTGTKPADETGPNHVTPYGEPVQLHRELLGQEPESVARAG